MKARELLELEDDNTHWVVTYADLMTLLLVFFVMLFSISSVEEDAFSRTLRSISSALDGKPVTDVIPRLPGPIEPIEPMVMPPGTTLPTAIPDPPPVPTPIVPPQIPASELMMRQKLAMMAETNRELEEVGRSLQQSFQISNDNQAVTVGVPRDGKMVVRISGSALFPSGSAEFSANTMPLLDYMIRSLRQNPQFRVAIQGHTDDIPINTDQFPSNWELSAIRATTVLRYFVRGGIAPDRVTATGYGSSIPLVANEDEASRSKNRRLEFVFEKRGERE